MLVLRAGFAQEPTRGPRPSLASRGAHHVRQAHGVLAASVGLYFLSRFSESTATPNSSPEEINMPVFQLIPKRSVFFEMGRVWGLIGSPRKAQPWSFFLKGEQIADIRGKRLHFRPKLN